MSSGTEYALRLREVEEERDRLALKVAWLVRNAETTEAESREVEAIRISVFWAMGWRRYVDKYVVLHGHPASSRFRRSRDRLARVLSVGGDASATGEKR